LAHFRRRERRRSDRNKLSPVLGPAARWLILALEYVRATHGGVGEFDFGPIPPARDLADHPTLRRRHPLRLGHERSRPVLESAFLRIEWDPDGRTTARYLAEAGPSACQRRLALNATCPTRAGASGRHDIRRSVVNLRQLTRSGARGEGYLRLMEIRRTATTVQIKTYSPYNGTYLTIPKPVHGGRLSSSGGLRGA
jgi:hypothetical protein